MWLRIAAAATACLAAEPAYEQRQIRRPDGASIAYYVRDAPSHADGPNLVLIPGSWGDHRVFDRFVAALPTDLRIIVVELRGHGASRPATARPSMAMFADDVLAAVDALGLRRFYVSGHSIGGMLSVEIVGRRPAAVAGAIPLEGWTHHEVARDAFPGDTSATMTESERAVNEANRQRVRSTLSDTEIAAFASVWRQWDGQRILESTPVPVLEIWGDRGRPRPPRASMRIPERPNIDLLWIAGASHSLLVQRPEEAADASARFIRRQEARYTDSLK